MTDKYEEAMAAFDAWVKSPTCNVYVPEPVKRLAGCRETIRHALANCLPELDERYYYKGIYQDENGWRVDIAPKDWDIARGYAVTGYGETPRLAAIEAIKKIEGGE